MATGAVAQQFHQGALQFTNNALDLAIQGNGFFVTSDGLTNLDRTYTRAGAFKLNESSYMVSNSGGYLQGTRSTLTAPQGGEHQRHQAHPDPGQGR